MSVGVGGNYISDGAILAWLANQQHRIYADLGESMDLAERRASMTGALNDIKMHLEEANVSHDFGKVDQELQAFMAEYGADPELAELTGTVGEIANRVHADYQYATQGHAVAMEKYRDEYAIYQQAVDRAQNSRGLENGAITELPPEKPGEPTVSYTDEQLKTWSEAIDGKMDLSSKNDQLTMIHIQELKGTLDQGTQLGSTLIAGSDKALDAIINNIA